MGAKRFSSIRSKMATARSCSTSGLRRTTLFSSRVTLAMRCGASPPSAGIDRLTNALDPGSDTFGIGLEAGPVHHQPRGNVGDELDFHEMVGLEGAAGRHEVDDALAKSQAGRQLHGARQPDAFRLDAPGGEMPAGDGRIFGRHPDMAPTGGIV